MLYTWHGGDDVELANACHVLLSVALIMLYDLHMQQFCDVFGRSLLYDLHMLCMIQPGMEAHAIYMARRTCLSYIVEYGTYHAV